MTRKPSKIPTGADTPLDCEIKDKVLVIRVGVNVLADAAKWLPDQTGWDFYEGRIKIRNRGVFAEDIVHALMREEEDGSSLLTKMLDRATEDAIGEGSLGLWFSEDYGRVTHDASQVEAES